MLRHAPLWLDRVPKSKRPSHPRWRGDAETRVVVVGGGLTGCACAYALVQAGVPVILLEADCIGAGSTAAGLGLLREDFAGSFEAAARAHGVRTARTLWQGTRRASLDFAAALRRLSIRCDLEPATLLHVARTDARVLKKELDARRAAGLAHTWKTPAATLRDTALECGGAISGPAFTCDPYRAALGLAAAAVARKAQIFEHSAVTRIRDRRRKSIEVTTEGGTIHAETAIIATSARLTDLRSLRRHLTPFHRYAVVTDRLTASVGKEVGTRKALLEDDDEPRHVVEWMKDGRALIAGGDQPAVAPRAQPQTLVQRTGQLMYELSLLYPAISGTMPAWSWMQPYDGTVDGLPFLGPHRNFPRHFFALGDTRHGPSMAWLASRLAVRWVTGRPDKGDETFGFGRVL